MIREGKGNRCMHKHLLLEFHSFNHFQFVYLPIHVILPSFSSLMRIEIITQS